MLPPPDAVLACLLAVACANDVAARRVPNAIVCAIAAFGVAVQAATGGAMAALTSVAAASLLLAVLLLPWRFGALGGGDVKLAVATSICLGPARIVPFVLLSAVAGIPVALASRAAHRLSTWRAVRAGVGPDGGACVGRETVPLAVAIAMGALGAVWRMP